jgi:hypothetical protein
MGEFLWFLFGGLLFSAITWFAVDRQGMKETLLDWRASAADQLGEDGAARLRLQHAATRRNLAILLVVVVVIVAVVGLISFLTAPQTPVFRLGVNSGVRDACGNTETINITADALALTKYVVIAGRDDRPTGGKDCRMIYRLRAAPAGQRNSDSDQIK